MLKEERQHYILDKIKLNRKALSSNLSIELNVSEDTIRRDLNELSKNGLIKKVHGGALPLDNKAPSYEERSSHSLKEKNSIAKKAVKLIKHRIYTSYFIPEKKIREAFQVTRIK